MVELISVHVPKTAGTAFRLALMGIYGAERVFEDYAGPSLPSAETLQNRQVIHGHFKADKYDLLFKDAQKIVWLRNPISRLISEYFYAQTIQDRTNIAHAQLLDHHLSLVDFAALPQMTNQIAVWLNRVALESFDFVGLQEWYQIDFQDLQRLMHWPDGQTDLINTNQYPNYQQRFQELMADHQLLQQIERLNQEDMELYHQALDLRTKRRKKSVFSFLHRKRVEPLQDRQDRQNRPQDQLFTQIYQKQASASSAEDGYPVPPDSLRWRAVGTRNPGAYLISSNRIAHYFDQRIRSAGANIADFEYILDFGCGAGRILRGLIPMTQARLIGCDIDSEAIAWNKQHLPFGQFYEAQEYPSLPFEANTFDFVYAVAVFDHLDEAHQFCWLEELQRISKPDGFVFATVKAPLHAQRSGGEEKALIEAQLKNRGFHYEVTNFWADVFPDYYQQAFHTPEYVQEHWSKYFTIIAIDPPGIINQHTILMKNSRTATTSL